MKKKVIFLLILLFCTSFNNVQSASIIDNPEVASNIRLLEAWIEAQIAYKDVPGMSVGIVYDQEMIWSKGFGNADRANKTPASPATIYRIASISKLFTSVAILKLRDEGKLQLDDPIKKHLPWFNIKNNFPDAPVITIRHLLTHTSGLPRESAFPYWTDFKFPTREQIIDKLPEQKTVYPSETKWKYSNLGLTIAGEIVAAVSGEPYEEYIHKNILNPLFMTSTSVQIGNEHKKRLATGYGRRMPDGSRAIMPFTDSKGITPAANLSSTVEDMAKFASWQLRLRENGGTEILKSSTLKEMQRVQWLLPNWQSGWGLGFSINHTADRDLIGHGGHVAGYTTQIKISPEEKIGVIVMTNADDGNPGIYVDKVFEWVAPAVVKAVKPPDQVAKEEMSWSMYVGKYRDSWADYEILIYNGKLTLIYPDELDPKASMLTLVPVSEHTFKVGGEGYGELGEPVVFELKSDGTVERMKVGENYVYPLK
ncbi:MAG: serine hydrolase [Candidatus Latescibacteria bacterium]|nr:serine hydrolase [Candidatus Latescibacterota bacterium]